MDVEGIGRNLGRLRERIAEAARRKGRDAGAVRLLAVTKTVGPREIEALYAAGQRDFGENRVVEAIRKLEPEAARWPEARWRFIGHLQTNKVRKAVGLFCAVDSVDSIRLAKAIGEEIAKRPEAEAFPVLAEVNAARETNKTGMSPEELEPFLKEAAALPRVRVTGLMTMAPYSDDPEASRPVFAALRELLGVANERKWYREPMGELSMGMTQDFEVAVEEGATWVRIGTALFV